jgi:hypothetical protein
LYFDEHANGVTDEANKRQLENITQNQKSGG